MARRAWVVGGSTRRPAGMSEEEGEAGMGHNEGEVAGNWRVAGLPRHGGDLIRWDVK